MADYIRENFTRQRRNLMAMSFFLIVFKYADLSLPQELSFTWTNAKVGNPEAVLVAAWVVWLYWLWRFFGYHLDLPNKHFREAHVQSIERLARAYALRQATRRFVERHKEKEEFAVIDARCENARLECQDLRAFQITLFKLQFVYTAGTAKGANSGFDETVQISSPHAVWLIAKAWVLTVWKSHVVSEYALPYALAIAAPIYWLVPRLVNAIA